jgi:hypothetical protein
MTDGFLSRWAKRKEAVRKGEEVPAEPQEVLPPVPPPQPSPGGGGSELNPLSGGGGLSSSPPPLGEGQGGGTTDQPPPPTLEDTQSLTPESDFTRFVQPDVTPEVKNAALKKLFTDPHFNAMDGLDVYIDDYNKADPLPPELLRQLASAKFLQLFEDKDKEEKGGAQPPAPAPAGREVADNPAPETVAESGTRTAQALPPADDHADPDLRLQQDDAPGRPGPGAGAR